MPIPSELKVRLLRLGLEPSMYERRTLKCVLSRAALPNSPVPWYSQAFVVDDTHPAPLGSYVFDPVSLVPCLALDPRPGDHILDLCAAPGTKTFIMAFLSNNEASIVANDVNRNRTHRLHATVNRYHLSAEVTTLSGRRVSGMFDKILVDAPCSGEGMVNKSEKLFAHWSEKRVRRMAKLQKKLLRHAYSLLRPGGTLVYSTCTLEPQENEEVAQALLKKEPTAALAPIEIPHLIHASGRRKWQGAEYDPRVMQAVRVYPPHNGTGGFFVAKITKPI